MKSEALRNIGTMRQVKTSLDTARGRKFRTTNSLRKTKEETDYLESLTDPRLEQALEKERRRFAAQEAAINRARQRLLKAREKLAMAGNKNRALTELRRKLQQTRWQEDDPIPPKADVPAPEPNRYQVELKY